MELQKFPSKAQFSASRSLEDFLRGDENTQKNSEHQTLDIPSNNNTTIDPFLLSFKNLTYNVKVGRKSRLLPCRGNNIISAEDNMKILLNDISGEAREGEITAILGASGSGKSTLLDALANRIDKNSLKGSVTLNGEVLESGLLKVISAYVMQDDLLFPMLTVEETLMFSADFRLPRSLSKAKKKARIQALIDQLGLRNAAKTIIGDEGRRGVSGGERRRVSIGIDIIHDPILLFLDEPTSGLDSTSAYKVVKVLRRIAQSGSIVIMSIHQPSSRITGLLDHLMFLSHGQTVYSGSPANLPTFFDNFGHIFPEHGNPADFALDFIRELEESPSGTQNLVEFNKSMNPDDNVISNYKRSLGLKDAIKRSIARGKLVSGAIATTIDVNLTSSAVPAFANPFWYEMLVLIKRLSTNSRRTPEEFGVRLATISLTAGLVAAMFWQIDESPKGVQERLACLTIALGAILYTSTAEIPEFSTERNILMRETAYNAYRRSSYVLARSLISIPTFITLSLIFSVILFWPIGFSGGFFGFFFFFLTNMAMFWTASSLVAFFGGAFSNTFIAFIISVAVESYFLFFSGFLLTRDRIPKYLTWLHYISVMKYPYEAMAQNEFLRSKCFVRGAQIFEQTPLGELPKLVKDELLTSMGNVLGLNVTDSTCVTMGKDILKLQDINQLNKWNNLWITIAWGFFYRILFYLTLLFGSKNKRK
ncbi:ABC transporter-like protein [Corchorus olitorius]|uniref:ABC transporter-like protein n=1 Tax=Corchorus olitorius TaxID=93759 RepID=A0A1R3KM18_9ROSI|nr:ABC transporter-like protein [Corchorus olitorius]